MPLVLDLEAATAERRAGADSARGSRHYSTDEPAEPTLGAPRILASYLAYYQRSRTHLSLAKDAPDGRSVQPVGAGKIVAFPQVGGLHHR